MHRKNSPFYIFNNQESATIDDRIDFVADMKQQIIKTLFNEAFL